MLDGPVVDLTIALALGLLVGLQEERAGSELAGLRTFGIVTLLGALAASLASPVNGPWLVAAGLLALTALLITGNLLGAREGEVGTGQTTEVAALIMYLVGAYVVLGERHVAVAVAAAIAAIVHLKDWLHTAVRAIGDADVRAILQFVVISLVILPLLPDRTYGPYDVLNPRQIWFMVVLIVGLDLAGYAARRIFGSRTGTVLAGVLGGLISSTATTAGYARRTAKAPEHARSAALVIVIASAVVFVRVLLEIGAVAPRFLPGAAPPLLILLLALVGLAFILGRAREDGPTDTPSRGNPTELKSALVFAGLYAGILLLVAAAEQHLGTAGLYAVAGLSGLTDMDAITLSTSNLVQTSRVSAGTAWRAIVVASLANLVFKTGIVATMGGRALLSRVAPVFATVVVVGIVLLAFWR